MRVLLISIVFFHQLGLAEALKCGVSVNITATHDLMPISIEANRGSWPWLVAIHQDGEHKCTGAIIKKRWVVTSATCFNDVAATSENVLDEESKTKLELKKSKAKDILRTATHILKSRQVSNWTIVAGEHELCKRGHPNYPSCQLRLRKVIMHEEYNPDDVKLPNDIALIKLKKPLLFNERVRPICLPEPTDYFHDLEPQCFVAGWDMMAKKDKIPIKQAHSQIIDSEFCKDLWEDNIDAEGSVCYGDESDATCITNPGSPLMCFRNGRWLLAGTATQPDKVCQQMPVVFTAVASQRQWIDRQIGKNAEKKAT